MTVKFKMTIAITKKKYICRTKWQGISTTSSPIYRLQLNGSGEIAMIGESFGPTKLFIHIDYIS